MPRASALGVFYFGDLGMTVRRLPELLPIMDLQSIAGMVQF